MKEITYTIDKDLSLKSSALVVKVTESGKDAHYLKNIVPSQWLQELKAMAMTGKIYFNGKHLAADFYGKVDFSYHVENINNQIKLSGKLKWSNQEIDLLDCDFLFQGPPLFFIKGIHLKIIGTEVTYKELKKLQDGFTFKPSDIEELELLSLEDENEPKIYITNHAKLCLNQSKEPTPYLILKDRTGAFADLWMDYGDDKKPYNDLKLKTSSEKAFEQDLFETDFVKKQMGNSNYYCPLDKVSKSLTFLLEIGWKIFDFKGRSLLKPSSYELELNEENKKILVRGSLNYDSHKVDLSRVAGAFNKRERFIEISDHTICLIPDHFESKDLESLMEISEVVGDALVFKTHKIGAIEDLLSSKNVVLSSSLHDLKEKLKGFSGVSLFLPPSEFKGILRPYQQEGVNFLKFLYDFQFHGMLADDMGLGKTVQVLAFLSQIKSKNPTLIVLPASLVFNWELEIKKFTPHLKVSIHHGKNRFPAIDLSADIILTTYSIIRMDLHLFQKVDFECLILDEAQTIKNADTITAKALCSLTARFRLSITGTPVENNLKELWSHFYFLMPELLGDENLFLADVQASASDMRYLQKIKKKIKPFIIRRKKNQVAKDLPERIEQTVYVEMEPLQRKVYEDYLSGIKNSLIKKVSLDGLSKHRMEVLEAILRLRQICCHPLLVSHDLEENIPSAKLESLLEDIDTAVSEGRKILIYSQFTSMLKLIAKAVTEKNLKFAYLDGSTTNREKVVSEFQEDSKIPLFLISLKAGGIGLNLTAADYVFIFDPWWNDAVENQAINRAHRIGRKDTVFAKRYITLETIEEKMMTLKKNKEKVASDILDDELSVANFTEDDFKFLLS